MSTPRCGRCGRRGSRIRSMPSHSMRRPVSGCVACAVHSATAWLVAGHDSLPALLEPQVGPARVDRGDVAACGVRPDDPLARGDVLEDEVRRDQGHDRVDVLCEERVAVAAGELQRCLGGGHPDECPHTDTCSRLSAVNGSALPPAPPGLQPEAGEPRHQVELAGPRVAQHHRVQLDAGRGQPDVVLDQPLADRIVLGDVEPHLVDPDLLGVDVLVVAQAVQVTGRERLDHEHAVVGQVLRHVAEAAHLRLLVGKVVERVEHDVGQAVAPARRDLGHVAQRDTDAVAARLLAEACRHRLRELDAVDLDALGGQRQCDPAGADRKLQRRPAPRLLGEERDCRALVAAQPRVVAPRDVLVEAHRRS